jgi:hypothetical protein
MESTPDRVRAQQRKITRNRELRACIECRRRKLKCDRHFPCSSCARRSEAQTCGYEKKFDPQHGDDGRRSRAEARLEHLEQLVQELSQPRQAASNHGVGTDLNVLQRRPGEQLDCHPQHGATHWSAVLLEDIQELRATMGEDDDREDPEMVDGTDQGDGIGLLFGAAGSLTFQQVLSHFLPARQEVDRAVAAYFRAKAVAAPFLHSAYFGRLYRTFWESPFTASPLWTSLLFSVLDISTRTKAIPASSTIGTVNDTNAKRFAIAAAHCLVIGEYYRPQRFAVEALLLYAQARCITSFDLSPELGILFGTLCRLATTMGYHRDPDGSREKISAFEGEIRRRAYSLCMQLDMLVSFQLGLPSNVQFPTWDTRPPTNLLDSDFDEDVIQLPPARPSSEATELLFYIAKHRLGAVFEKVIRHTLSTADVFEVAPLDEIDQELRQTYAALPAVFQSRAMSEPVFDSPSLIVTRLCLNQIYQKCLCVLHRKYVLRGRQTSISVCWNSALNLVRQVLDVHKEFRIGGQLESESWYLGSLTWHDFLLGCTGVCLVICCTTCQQFTPWASQKLDPSPSLIFHRADGAQNRVEDAKMLDFDTSLDLLLQAIAVCDTNSVRSKDTRKVRRLLEATISKLIGHRDGITPTAEPTVSSTEDDVWAFMEQVLDLPRGDLMYDV